MSKAPFTVADVMHDGYITIHAVLKLNPGIRTPDKRDLGLLADKLYEIEMGIREGRILPPPESVARGPEKPSLGLKIRRMQKESEMNDRICPGCGKVIGDDDTILRQNATDTYWHITCHDLEHRRRLMEPKMNEVDPADWARASAAAGAEPVRWWNRDGEEVNRDGSPVGKPYPTINYHITPQRFILEIPVEALPSLSNDAQTRMLNMLNDWIQRHKPMPVLVSVPKEAKP